MLMRCAQTVRALTCLAILTVVACEHSAAQKRSERAPYFGTDSMGAIAKELRRIRVRGQPDLVENSAAVMSVTQPGILFTINDSGNDALLFALDTSGADRGTWRVAGATNVDWESAALGPCAAPGTAARASADSKFCLYIGDTGDNNEMHPSRAIYRVIEPAARARGFRGSVTAEKLAYRYPDGPHDVEAMYVAPNADIFLITKRRLKAPGGRLRPALVFTLPAAAWPRGAGNGGPTDSMIVAVRTDSLPIVPGSAPMRTITDAALSPDARRLAVRTYAQVYVFAVDSATGRVIKAVPPAACNVATVQTRPGEGITWVGRADQLLLTSEGAKSSMQIVTCPMPEPAASPLSRK